MGLVSVCPPRKSPLSSHLLLTPQIHSNKVIDGVGRNRLCSVHTIITADCHLYPTLLGEASLSKHALSTVQPPALLEHGVRGAPHVF